MAIDAAVGTSATPSSKPPMIEAHGLVKRYGTHVAVDHLDLVVHDGEIFGILGPNGAGKTTTLEMLEGLRPPDEGTIRVAGFDPARSPNEVKRVVGVQLQSTSLFDYLTISELVALFAALYNADGSPERVTRLIDQVGLGEKRDARIDQLSGGQRQRVAIALALVNDPKVVFLDEPTTGLDPAARRTLWSTVQGIRDAGTTVVLTTHYMEEADVLCDRVAVMDRGKIVACDTPARLVDALAADATVRARVTGDLPMDDLRALPGALRVECVSPGDRCEEITITTDDAQGTLVGLLALADQARVPLAGLTTRQATLEDVFLSMTGRAWEDEPTEATPEQPTGRRGRRRGGKVG